MSWGNPVYINGEVVGYTADPLEVQYTRASCPVDSELFFNPDPRIDIRFQAVSRIEPGELDRLAEIAARTTFGFKQLQASLTLPMAEGITAGDLRRLKLRAPEPWTPPGERPAGNRAERRRRL